MSDLDHYYLGAGVGPGDGLCQKPGCRRPESDHPQWRAPAPVRETGEDALVEELAEEFHKITCGIDRAGYSDCPYAQREHCFSWGQSIRQAVAVLPIIAEHEKVAKVEALDAARLAVYTESQRPHTQDVENAFLYAETIIYKHLLRIEAS